MTLVVGIVATVAVLVTAGVLGARGAPAGPSALESDTPAGLPDLVNATSSEPLPDVTLGGFAAGPELRTSEYRGTPLVVNFWATWCPPCVEEMPAFQEVSEEPNAPAFLGVNLEDDLIKAERLVNDLGVTYDLAVDVDGDLFAEVGGFGMPTTLLVDADGVTRYRHTGPLDAEQLRGLLAEHLDQS